MNFNFWICWIKNLRYFFDEHFLLFFHLKIEIKIQKSDIDSNGKLLSSVFAFCIRINQCYRKQVVFTWEFSFWIHWTTTYNFNPSSCSFFANAAIDDKRSSIILTFDGWKWERKSDRKKRMDQKNGWTKRSCLMFSLCTFSLHKAPDMQST